MTLPSADRGRVVALQANFCRVRLDQPGPHGSTDLLCTRRTRLGKSGQVICVGDRVRLEGIDWSAGRGAVAALEPRHSLLERPAVANVDRVVVVVALRDPEPDPLQITRFLITAEATGQPVDLVFTKADLLPEPEVAAWIERVRGWGYGVVAVSTRSGQGLDDLRARLCRPGIAVLCGPSGVGKSSLLNALLPELALRTADVSGRLRRGRHTTRHVELFRLPGGEGEALLADSPGFNRPIAASDPQTLAQAFPELRRRLAGQPCRFRNCRHQGDPGCAMGSDWDRYGLYGDCLAELEARSAGSRSRSAGERGETSGVRRGGQRLEPLLDPRLRRVSRRRSRQEGLEEGHQAPGSRGVSPPDPADSDPDRR
ncbi:MAG: ribosome small subunit-dependent GTPase A [Cyanobacteriota bacterium]|nr:ribosome small subunit-dependent GTPase A [Cyanobacteriota bacterium]